MPQPPHLEAPFYDEYYGARPKMPPQQGNPAQHCLAKLDTFSGENGKRFDEFVYQVEEFADFHDWDPIETCRQARTHLRGVVLAYIRHTQLPPRTWEELKDLRTHGFQLRDLTASYKAQFRARR